MSKAGSRGESGEQKQEVTDLSAKMRQDWDQRARENAFYYVATAREDWTEEDFFASGRQTVQEFILGDMVDICRGRDPQQMRILEIGCGAGRVTRALAEVFGEVWAVDVSPQMVEKARASLADCQNVHLCVNNGQDLRVLDDRKFDFALSILTFQHIPSKAIIANYISETARLLVPGALFKFQVQGFGSLQNPDDDTWLGAGLTREEMQEMADATGFQFRHWRGAGEQYFTNWFYRKGDARLEAEPNPAEPCGVGTLRTVLRWDAPGVEYVRIRLGSEDGTVFAHDKSWGEQVLEFSASQDLICYLLDASGDRELATVRVRVGN